MYSYLYLSNNGDDALCEIHGDAPNKGKAFLLSTSGRENCPVIWLLMIRMQDIFTKKIEEPDGEVFEIFGAKIDIETAITQLRSRLVILNHIFSGHGTLDECVDYFTNLLMSLNYTYLYFDFTELASRNTEKNARSLFTQVLDYFDNSDIPKSRQDKVGRDLILKLCYLLKFEKDASWRNYMPTLFGGENREVESFTLAQISEHNFHCMFGRNYSDDNNYMAYEERLKLIDFSASTGDTVEFCI